MKLLERRIYNDLNAFKKENDVFFVKSMLFENIFKNNNYAFKVKPEIKVNNRNELFLSFIVYKYNNNYLNQLIKNERDREKRVINNMGTIDWSYLI